MILYKYTGPSGDVWWVDDPKEVIDMFGGDPSDCIKGEWTVIRQGMRTMTRKGYSDPQWQKGYIFDIINEVYSAYIDQDGHYHLKRRVEIIE